MKARKSIASNLVLAGSFLGFFLPFVSVSCSGGASGGPQNPTITSVTVTASPSSVTLGQSSTCTATVNGTGAYSSGVNWSATNGTITAAGVLTPTAVGSSTCTATSQVSYGSTTAISGSATVTVTPVPVTITGVSLACTPSSITDAQTTICVPTVTGTGLFTNTVNLSVSPSSSGSLSVTSNVSSGSAVTFTPVETAGATVTITATSTADATKSGQAMIPITLRTITIGAATGNIWAGNCTGIYVFNATQTGILQGDTLHFDPYPSSTFTTAPAATFPISVGMNSTGTGVLCSPGAYDLYVTGTDGATSNTHYVPIINRWNTSAGTDGTDIYQMNYTAGKTCKFKNSDGTLDGTCIPFAGLAGSVDATTNSIAINYENRGVAVYNTTTGNSISGFPNSRSGDTLVGMAMKNGDVCYTRTSPSGLTCYNGINFSGIYDNGNAGTTPAAITMTKGCGTASNTTSVAWLDEQAMTVGRVDVTNSAPDAFGGISVTGTSIGTVALNGFSPASALTTTLARYIVSWDTNCTVAVVDELVSGTTYTVGVALVNLTAGSMQQLTPASGSSVSIPGTAIRVAPDPAGNAIVIASTNESAGQTNFTKVSWTSGSTPTITSTALTSVSAVGTYGVALDVTSTGIHVGQQQMHQLLPNK